MENRETAMKLRTLIVFAACILSGCASRPLGPSSSTGSAPSTSNTNSTGTGNANKIPSSQANSIEAYKREVANRIAATNANKVYLDNPQALLRAVIVVRYVVSADGRLLSAEIQRSNHDKFAENTALACLQNSAPFPKPASHLLRGGRLEVSETWLFNDDGRFQLRSVALPQQGE
jgi:protein TonB